MLKREREPQRVKEEALGGVREEQRKRERGKEAGYICSHVNAKKGLHNWQVTN